MWAAWAVAARARGRTRFATVRLATSGAARLDPAGRAGRSTSASALDAHRGLRPHRGVAGRHLRARASTRPGEHRRAAARAAGAPRRRRRPGRARRRRGRDLGARARTCSRATGTTPRPPRRALTADGWLRTGDVAVVDDDGFLFLVDRAKDLIIVSGFNVYPAEVEEVIAAHPARRRRSRWSACPTRTPARR